MLVTYTKEVTVDIDALTLQEACEKILAMEQELEFSSAFFMAGGFEYV